MALVEVLLYHTADDLNQGRFARRLQVEMHQPVLVMAIDLSEALGVDLTERYRLRRSTRGDLRTGDPTKIVAHYLFEGLDHAEETDTRPDPDPV